MYATTFCVSSAESGQSRHHGRPSINMRLARRSLSLLRFGHEKSRGLFARLHHRFVLLHKQRAEGRRLQLANLQIVFHMARRNRMSSICFCVSGFGCPCVSRGRFVLCDLASGVPDDCVKAQFCTSPFQRKNCSQVLRQHGD